MRLILTWALMAAALIQPVTLDAQTKPLQAWLGSDTSMPVPTYRVLPSLAADGAPVTVRGAVEIEVVVDAAGRVAHARVVTPLGEAFDRASLEATRRWRFRPAHRSGRPVTTLIGVRFMFLPPKAPGGSPEVSGLTGLLARRPLPAPAAPLTAYPTKGTAGLDGPRLIRAVTPEYTEAAMLKKVQGDVAVEVVVMPDGTVGSARILRSLDSTYGLDEQALIAARYWFFEPATLNAHAVPVTSTLILTFRLN